SVMENTRLLYIGVTRAINKTWLLGSVTTESDNFTRPDANSLLATIWPALQGLWQMLSITLIPVSGNDTDCEPPESLEPQIKIRRLPTDWQHPLLSQISGCPLQEEVPVEEREPAHHNLLAKKSGEIIHYCLKLAVEKNLSLASLASDTNLHKNWEMSLQAFSEDSAACVATIVSQLHQCERHPLASWLLDPRHDNSACELSISDYRHGFRKEYIIDRTFIDADNVRWIIDYKSSTPAPEESLKDFLAAQAWQYRSQLERYAELFTEMESRPVKTALFFTAIPCFHEIG
ncbi:MAG: hypothetical protein WD601_02100, partial [Pseudohongiellaceae bacterium]